MRASLWLLLTIVTLLSSSVGAKAQFNPRYAGEKAWAEDRISGLATEIRSNVLSYRKACGLPFTATKAFARPTYYRAPVVALHYESLWCEARQAGICRGADCLHEVYVREGNRYRLSFRGFVKEVDVTLDGAVRILRDGD